MLMSAELYGFLNIICKIFGFYLAKVQLCNISSLLNTYNRLRDFLFIFHLFLLFFMSGGKMLENLLF